MLKIFVVTGWNFVNYESSANWNVCYFLNKEEAEQFAAECTKSAKEYLEKSDYHDKQPRNEEWYRKDREIDMMLLDPNFDSGDKWGYKVEELLTREQLKTVKRGE